MVVTKNKWLSKVFARTKLGESGLSGGRGGVTGIAGDEMRVMSLIDGKTSVEAISRKLPPSLQPHVDGIVSRLLVSRFIVEVGRHSPWDEEVATPRISREEVRHSLMSSQKLNKNMLALAEVEIERRMELEQDLSEARELLLSAQTELDEVKAQLAAEAAKYQSLRQQVLVYKEAMQAKMTSLHAHIEKITHTSQARKSECAALEDELKRLRDGWQQMQEESEEKQVLLDATLRQRILQEKFAEEEERKRIKMQADEMVRTHPHYNLLRRLSFFQDFRNSDIAQFLIYAQWREVKAGESVIVEGCDDCMLYLIVTGKLGVLKANRTLHVLNAGEPFGELSYMDEGHPVRNASVVARTDSLLLEFNPAYLDESETVFRMRVAESLVRIQAKRLNRAIDVVNNLLTEDVGGMR